MKVLNNGYFSDSWDGEVLAKGLRSTAKTLRGVKTFSRCDGLVGQDGLLTTLPAITLTPLYASPLVIKNDFPFPQIFTLEKFIIVCNRTSILELVGSSLVSKATVTGGELWSLASSHDFLYLSNGVVSLVRNPQSGEYESTDAPVCSAILNFNGQIICGNIR